MRLSQTVVSTLREDPSDAEVPSHRLLAKAGLIVKVAAGVYTFSPLMARVVKKFAQIVREELDAAGASEVLLPIVQPKDLWVSSGRWDRMTGEGLMFTLKDRKGTEMCLGPTHEEVITSYVDTAIASYKQLPINLYQVQDKFRDEIRPRFGLMRAREFSMMDAYSFDVDEAALDEAYAKMRVAYQRIFDRCDLEDRVVQADAGAIGGSGSEEFMVLAETGEDTILYADEDNEAANVEKAVSKLPAADAGGDPEPIQKHNTPNVRTVAQLEEFFSLPAGRMAKTVLYSAAWPDREQVIAVMMRGDLEINEVKLAGLLDTVQLHLADEEAIAKHTGAETGFAGPVGLPEGVPLYADESLRGATNLITGCNETGKHCTAVNLGRDTAEPEWIDVRLARVGEMSASGAGVLKAARGIEVGHIFKLGTKYSAAMGATFMGQNGKPTPFVMGCYGIGVTRTPAAAVEQNFDDKGIVWPMALAPFEVVVAILDPRKAEQKELGESIYSSLREAGIDVCLDDRQLSPGAKFKDLELLGFPLQVFVGRNAKDGNVEFLVRKGMTKSDLPASEVLPKIRAAIQAASR